MFRTVRRGFTLIEVLVVIGIVGMLVALLLPAISSARDAARRANCQSHLHQIGVALHNYHETFNMFPPGAVLSAAATATGCPPRGVTNEGAEDVYFTWTISILPNIEQESLFNQLDPNLPVATRRSEILGQAEHNGTIVYETMPRLYRCPSNPRSSDLNILLDYVGVMGGGDDCVFDEETCPRGALCEGDPGRLFWDNGIFYANSSVSFADVTDGTSNVYLVGETNYMRLPEDNTSGPEIVNTPSWAGGMDLRPEPYWASTQTMAAAVLAINTWPVDYGDSGYFMRLFGSDHPGGANMLMVDGSAHFVNELMDLDIHRSLGARNDARPTGGAPF